MRTASVPDVSVERRYYTISCMLQAPWAALVGSRGGSFPGSLVVKGGRATDA
jgi:hypothetical protein